MRALVHGRGGAGLSRGMHSIHGRHPAYGPSPDYGSRANCGHTRRGTLHGGRSADRGLHPAYRARGRRGIARVRLLSAQERFLARGQSCNEEGDAVAECVVCDSEAARPFRLVCEHVLCGECLLFQFVQREDAGLTRASYICPVCDTLAMDGVAQFVYRHLPRRAETGPGQAGEVEGTEGEGGLRDEEGGEGGEGGGGGGRVGEGGGGEERRREGRMGGVGGATGT